jgi:hypothetical protein
MIRWLWFLDSFGLLVLLLFSPSFFNGSFILLFLAFEPLSIIIIEVSEVCSLRPSYFLKFRIEYLASCITLALVFFLGIFIRLLSYGTTHEHFYGIL